MNLERVSWAVVVGICVIAVLLLALNGYVGYAIVIAAVGGSAAINLT